MTLLLALLCLQDPANAELERINARLKENPKDVPSLLQRGNWYQRQRQLEKGLADFDEAVRLQPDNAQAHLSRGMCLMAMNRRDEALASWEKAIALDPKLRSSVEELKSGRGPRRHMSPEEVDRQFAALKPWLQENDPEMLRMIEHARPEEFPNLVRDAQRRKEELEELKQRDPDQYARMTKMRDLERGCAQLAEKIRREGATPELKKQLSEVLAQLFDLREEQRARELADLRRRVDELEKTLQKRRENRQAIIDKRLRELTGEKGMDDW